MTAESSSTLDPQTAWPQDRNHACVVCSYNLRGLQFSAACPECNTPVSLSIERSFLDQADQLYLRRLERSSWIILISGLTLLVSIAGPVLLALADWWVRPDFDLPRSSPVLFFTLVIAGVITFAGWWSLAARDGTLPEKHRSEPSRRQIRLATVAGMAPIVLLSAARMTGSGRGVLDTTTASIVIPLVASSAFLWWWLATMRYTVHLGRRGRDKSSATLPHACLWLGCTVTLLFTASKYVGIAETRATRTYMRTTVINNAKLDAWVLQAEAQQQAGQPQSPQPALLPLSDLYLHLDRAGEALYLAGIFASLITLAVYTSLIWRLRSMIRRARIAAQTRMNDGPALPELSP